MSRKSLLLTIEILVLAGPTSLMVALAFPYALIGSLYTLLDGNPLVVIGTTGCVWALFQFWKLAFFTITGHTYKFGTAFGSGLIGASVGIYVMHAGLPEWFSAILFGLPCIGLLHLCCEQSLLRAKSSLAG